MSLIKEALNKLTDNYRKSKDSNIGKLFQLVFSELDDVKHTFRQIEEWQDIDKAEGIALDQLGKRVGEDRGKKDDETYRKYIKLRILINRSAGEIETLNEVFDVYFDGDFVGLEEGWVNHEEPASIYAEIKPSNAMLPSDLLNQVKAGGVRLQLITRLESELSAYFASALTAGEQITVYPWQTTELITHTHSRLGSAMQSVDDMTIYPK